MRLLPEGVDHSSYQLEVVPFVARYFRTFRIGLLTNPRELTEETYGRIRKPSGTFQSDDYLVCHYIT